MALERELAVFEAHRAEWVAEHEGQFVAIQDENVAGFFPLWEAALKAAYKQYGIGRGPFLIKEVKLVDRIEFIGLTAQGSLPCFGVWRMQQNTVSLRLSDRAIMDANRNVWDLSMDPDGVARISWAGQL